MRPSTGSTFSSVFFKLRCIVDSYVVCRQLSWLYAIYGTVRTPYLTIARGDDVKSDHLRVLAI